MTFGDSAREAYERMIEMVSLAEDLSPAVASRRRQRSLRHVMLRVAAVAPIVRGACSARKTLISKAPGGGWCSNFEPATPC